MPVVLADTSIWIAAQVGSLDLLALRERFELAVCPPVMQEILQGANTAAMQRLFAEMLSATIMIESPVPVDRFAEAAQLYLDCRADGFTVGGYDCLIAAIAIAHDVPLLHSDRDYDFLAEVSPLKAISI